VFESPKPTEPRTLAGESDSFFEQEHTVLDLLVYATNGLVTKAAELLTEASDEVRKRIKSANTIGKFVTPAIQRKLKTVLRERLRDPASTFTSAAWVSPTPLTPRTSPSASPSPSSLVPAAKAKPSTSKPSRTSKPIKKATTVKPNQDATSSLGIDGYDDLPSASIVPLLGGLTVKQLAAVHRHELAHRARRTILLRASQLVGPIQSAEPQAADLTKPKRS
jgi:hypothetical protein